MKIPPINDRHITYTIVGIFAIFLAIHSLGVMLFNDFYWHLMLGKLFVEKHAFITHDLFSYTFPNGLWLNITWIFDALMYCIFSTWSYLGLHILRVFIFLATYYFFIKTSVLKKNASLLLSIAIAILTIPLARDFFRPELVQNLFVGYFLYVLYRFKYSRSRLIYTLPFVEIVWTNIHGSLLLGPMLIALFCGCELFRSLIVNWNNPVRVAKNSLILPYLSVLFAAILAMLINPYGTTMFRFLQVNLEQKETLMNIIEWMPLTVNSLFNIPLDIFFAFNVIVFLTACILIAKIVKTIRRQGIDGWLIHAQYEDLGLFVMFLYMPLQHQRFTHLFTLVAMILIVKNIQTIVNKERLAIIAKISAVAAVAIFAFSQHDKYTLRLQPSLTDIPRELITFIKSNKLEGNMLNEYAAGSDLIWYLYPDYKVFIDGRAANLYSGDFFWYYITMLDNETVFKEVSDRYNFNYAIASTESKLADALSKSKDWSLVFFDNYGLIFVRNTEKNKKLLDTYTYRILSPLKEDTEYLALCSKDTEKKQVIAELERNRKELASAPYSDEMLASMLIACPGSKQDDFMRAAQLLDEAIKVKPNNLFLYHKRGAAFLELFRNDLAIDNFKRSIAIDKTRLNMTGLGIAYYNLHNYTQAQKVFQQVPFLPGKEPPAYFQYFGRNYYMQGNFGKAVEYLERYWAVQGRDTITEQDKIDLDMARARALTQ